LPHWQERRQKIFQGENRTEKKTEKKRKLAKKYRKQHNLASSRGGNGKKGRKIAKKAEK